jgi:hypothetical protein
MKHQEVLTTPAHDECRDIVSRLDTGENHVGRNLQEDIRDVENWSDRCQLSSLVTVLECRVASHLLSILT